MGRGASPRAASLLNTATTMDGEAPALWTFADKTRFKRGTPVFGLRYRSRSFQNRNAESMQELHLLLHRVVVQQHSGVRVCHQLPRSPQLAGNPAPREDGRILREVWRRPSIRHLTILLREEELRLHLSPSV